MKFDELTYTVSEMMGPPQKLTVQANGDVRYDSYSNASTPDQPEIGIYQTKLPLQAMEALSRGLDEPPFASLADHWGRIAAGDRYHRVSIRVGSTLTEKMVGTTEPIDPNMAALIRRVDQIAAFAMHSPKRVIRMNISQASIDTFGTLTIDFELSCRGDEGADLVNPSTLAGSPKLAIRGWPDKAPAEFRAGEVLAVNAAKVTPLEAQSPPVREQALIQIAPGTEKAFRVSAPLHVPAPQTYIIQLIYQNTTDELKPSSLLIGELISKVVKLKVPSTSR